MMDVHAKPSCWIITEGIAGTENQCTGIAEALKINYDTKRISLNQPWKSLSPYVGFEYSQSFEPKIIAPYPDLLISSGRKSIAAARYIKKQSQGKTIIVQVQDPRSSYNIFDLIAVPEHDPIRGDNVIVTRCSPNKITPDKLTAAKTEFSELESPPSPRVAVLIGGSSKAYNMSRAVTEALAQNLKSLDASLMITCSRRTGEVNQKILDDALNNGSNYFWNGDGANPYMAILAWADYILVTADSASMISDSCTTGKPVYMIALDGGSRRIMKMHDNLMCYGALRKFEGRLENFTYEPLNDSKIVADEIKKRFGTLLNITNN